MIDEINFLTSKIFGTPTYSAWDTSFWLPDTGEHIGIPKVDLNNGMLAFSASDPPKLKSTHLYLAKALGTYLPILPIASDEENLFFKELYLKLEKEWQDKQAAAFNNSYENILLHSVAPETEGLFDAADDSINDMPNSELLNASPPINATVSEMLRVWNLKANEDCSSPRRFFYKCFDSLKSHLNQFLKFKNAEKTRAAYSLETQNIIEFIRRPQRADGLVEAPELNISRPNVGNIPSSIQLPYHPMNNLLQRYYDTIFIILACRKMGSKRNQNAEPLNDVEVVTSKDAKALLQSSMVH